jgi:hypothetical protein
LQQKTKDLDIPFVASIHEKDSKIEDVFGNIPSIDGSNMNMSKPHFSEQMGIFR